MKKTVKEISEIYKVSTMGVHYWIKKGLKYEIEKVIGIKPRKIISIKDVEDFLKLTRR